MLELVLNCFLTHSWRSRIFLHILSLGERSNISSDLSRDGRLCFRQRIKYAGNDDVECGRCVSLPL